MSRAYYNDSDAYVCDWLENLIRAGHIASGDVDRRSIVDVRPDDLRSYTQCHFFAGIGGWSYALDLAGFPHDRECWTGSCPCQPLSSAGRRKGHLDERHLWPPFYGLISECRPPVVFGEQVESPDGREWLAGVRADLEAAGYACGAADLCAASAGAPHRRPRLYFVADAKRTERRTLHSPRRDEGPHGLRQGQEGSSWPRSGRENDRAENMGNSASPRLEGQWSEYRPSGERHSGLVGFAMQVGVPEWNGPTVAVECSDGARRVSAQPDAFPLAHGVPARMGKLRAAGNAIVPQVAAEFISAFLDIEG